MSENTKVTQKQEINTKSFAALASKMPEKEMEKFYYMMQGALMVQEAGQAS